MTFPAALAKREAQERRATYPQNVVRLALLCPDCGEWGVVEDTADPGGLDVVKLGTSHDARFNCSSG